MGKSNQKRAGLLPVGASNFKKMKANSGLDKAMAHVREAEKRASRRIKRSVDSGINQPQGAYEEKRRPLPRGSRSPPPIELLDERGSPSARELMEGRGVPGSPRRARKARRAKRV